MIKFPVSTQSSTEERQSLVFFKDHQKNVSTFRSVWSTPETPLCSLKSLADTMHTGEILVKDEGSRCGLPAFKVLGVSYALWKLQLPTGSVVCTMTDGNHGLALASVAKSLGYESHIFVPANMSKERRDAIQKAGGNVIATDGTYDDAIKIVKQRADENSWHLISDTSWPGYEHIPSLIVAGYGTLFKEIENQRRGTKRITHVFVQAGVGGLASAAAAWLSLFSKDSDVWHPEVQLLIVEPTDAACLYENFGRSQDNLVECSGKTDSIMSGLNCGLPSYSSWPIIAGRANGYLLVSDNDAEEAVRTLAANSIVAGESGATGLAGLTRHHQTLNIDKSSVILIINTESDTDKESYLKILSKSK